MSDRRGCLPCLKTRGPGRQPLGKVDCWNYAQKKKTGQDSGQQGLAESRDSHAKC